MFQYNVLGNKRVENVLTVTLSTFFLSLSLLSLVFSIFTKILSMALHRFKGAKVSQGSSMPKSNRVEESLLTITK
jgi:hypothetical protein